MISSSFLSQFGISFGPLVMLQWSMPDLSFHLLDMISPYNFYSFFWLLIITACRYSLPKVSYFSRCRIWLRTSLLIFDLIIKSTWTWDFCYQGFQSIWTTYDWTCLLIFALINTSTWTWNWDFLLSFLSSLVSLHSLLRSW